MKSSHKQDKYTLEQSYALLYEQFSSDEQEISRAIDQTIKGIEKWLLEISRGAIAARVEDILSDLISLQADIDDGTLKNDEIEGGYPDGIPQQARANSMKDPEEVVENLKRLFDEHPEVERIYRTNMDAFGEITPDVVESIAEELREAGYSTGFILQNTGIDL